MNFFFFEQLPIEDLNSLVQPSLTVTLTATLPESTENILLKGFSSFGMENERIETAQQVKKKTQRNSKLSLVLE